MERSQINFPQGSMLIKGKDGQIIGVACHDGSWDISPEGRRFLAGSEQEKRTFGTIVRGLIHTLCKTVR